MSERRDEEGDERFVVVFEAYEGPIDALLDLARAQRVDLGAIDLVSLVGQFEAVLARALELRIEVAADWLVAAAWLAYLKSRSLIRRPKAAGEPDEPDEDALAFQLRRLDAVRTATAALSGRRQVGVDWFSPSGKGDDAPGGRLDASLHDLLKAYAAISVRGAGVEAAAVPALKPHDVCSVDGAIASLGAALAGRDWTDIVELAPRAASALRSRSNLASHLVAALELARTGRADVAQERIDAAVMVREANRVDA